MIPLSMDYVTLVRVTGTPVTAGKAGPTLLDALAERYQRQHPVCSLVQFMQSGATYLFDFASQVHAVQEDRTIAAWTVTPTKVGKRGVSYQHGFPLPPDPDRALADRGHLIPHLSGGEFGPNIFRQHRALNRGWSNQGKRYQAQEKEVTATPGALYFGHLLYDDDTAYPAEIEIGLLRGEALYVERFRNRLPPHAK